MLLFSLTFGNAACQAHTINYSPRVRISCSQCSHSYVIVNTQSQASRIKQVKHGIAASPAAPRNDRKRNQPSPLALSLRVSETSAAIPTPKTASKARLAEILLRKHRSCHNERGNLRQSHHNLPSLPTLTPRCHCERVKRAWQSSPKKYPPQKNKRKRKKPA